ncbi:nitrogen assimilation transcription factor nirA [Achaetomium macrosporum]|uniref:Nitrogen assimilation transcription factor nirA n=1 Tax=Achaetomium macrosporum TaxID=79813 RepID=A0AAN7H5T7_9PEZI|nr:nitrogen assimilation transcription factor nirA [Achaetomium macrosporum]
MENHNHQSQPQPILPSARRLLPAVRPQPVYVHPPPSSCPAPLSRQRKAHSTAACETCRKRKVKCNAARPTCSYCLSAGINCVYPTSSATETHAQALKRKLSEVHDRETTFRQIFQHLRDRPETEVCEIVKRIRDGTEPEQILGYIREGDLLLQLALAPERRYRYVFPLVQEMPAFLMRPDNPYLTTWVHDWEPLAASAPAFRDMVLSRPACDRPHESPYFMPYHVAEMVDPLLDSVKPSEWTAVSSDDDLMRRMLACFFMNIYQFFPSFQKEYFLQDMASGRQSYCSSLLVNSVLAAASFAYPELPNRYQCWNPTSLTYQFIAEASRLWDIEMESGRVRLPTLQASILLDSAINLTGKDEDGFPIVWQAIDMAERAGLFSPADHSTRQDTRMSRAKAFTAWALFNFQSLIAFPRSKLPRLLTPPDIPLPDPDRDPDWYGQIWLRYPGEPKLYTTHFPHQFQAQSGMRMVMAMECLYRDHGKGWDSPARLQIVNDYYYGHLKPWYENLPEPLTPSRITFPSHLILHLHYQNLVVKLFEPFCSANPALAATGLPPAPGQPPTEPPLQIRDAAARHLETLLRLYYLRHGFEHLDIYSGYFLSQLGFMTLQKLNSLPACPSSTSFSSSSSSCSSSSSQTPSLPFSSDEIRALRSTLILTAKGLHDQGRSAFINKFVLRTLAAKMAPADRQALAQLVGWDAITPEDAEVEKTMRCARSKVMPSSRTSRSLADESDREAHRLGRVVGEQFGNDRETGEEYQGGRGWETEGRGWGGRGVGREKGREN